MPIARPAIRPTPGNRLHHVWSNNGTWWCHYTVHFDHRKRRIRRSLKTADVEVAIARRDALFARLSVEGEEVPEQRPSRRRRTPADTRPTVTIVASALRSRWLGTPKTKRELDMA